MRVLVCVKPTAQGEINPFDASAYEAALRLPESEVTILTMAPESAKDALSEWTRLGAREAVLLSDPEFAGADTLATATTLAAAIRKLSPDLVLCGRQTVDGDTGQVGPELAEMLGIPLIAGAMDLSVADGAVCAPTRFGGERNEKLPALVTVERFCTLRLPSLRSRRLEAAVLRRADLGLKPSECGNAGSPTRVLRSFANEDGKRKCRWIGLSDLDRVIGEALLREKTAIIAKPSKNKLKSALIIGEACRPMAETVAETVVSFDLSARDETDFLDRFVETVRKTDPPAVFWADEPKWKILAARAAARLRTGLSADCTFLETDGQTLFFYRPAFSGSLIAEIICRTSPPMATLRCAARGGADVILSVGKGAAGALDEMRRLSIDRGWELGASRGIVDAGLMPYGAQIGLTGKNAAPKVYLAVGISGAVHHLAGMRSAGTVIAVNPDRGAAIFSYADYGIAATAEDLCRTLK